MAKKVLIIEDEANIREVYAEVLREVNYEVIESADGQDGVEKALTGNWDIMLLDIMLPKKDGLELLAEVKKNEALKDKPVVLLTNLGRDSIIKEGYNLGAVGYLVKSEINPDDVIKAVNKFITSDELSETQNSL